MADDKKLECKLCFTPFDLSLHDPRMLECMHTVCLTCADKLASEALGKGAHSLACPFCSGTTHIVESYDQSQSPAIAFKRNFSIMDYLASSATSYKINCERPKCGSKDAVVVCTCCRRKMCSECAEWHEYFFKGQTQPSHRVVPISKLAPTLLPTQPKIAPKPVIEEKKPSPKVEPTTVSEPPPPPAPNDETTHSHFNSLRNKASSHVSNPPPPPAPEDNNNNPPPPPKGSDSDAPPPVPPDDDENSTPTKHKRTTSSTNKPNVITAATSAAVVVVGRSTTTSSSTESSNPGVVSASTGSVKAKLAALQTAETTKPAEETKPKPVEKPVEKPKDKEIKPKTEPTKPVAETKTDKPKDKPKTETKTDHTKPEPPAGQSAGTAKLPPGWIEATDPRGRKYFYHREKKVTQWEFPTGEPGEKKPETKAEDSAPPPSARTAAVTTALPAGWEELSDPSGKPYYYNRSMKKTQWSRPEPEPANEVPPPPAPVSDALPPGWVETTDPNSGKKYYYNKTTKATSWNRPSA